MSLQAYRSDGPHRSPQWVPVLHGTSAAAAAACVLEIADAVERRIGSSEHGTGETRGDGDWSLGRGRAGIAVLFAYMARWTSDERYARTATAALESASELVAAVPTPPGLYTGFSGVAWAITHVARVLGEPASLSDLSDVDELLSTAIARAPWQGEYDLISGLVGLGVYAIERLPDPSAAAFLASVVGRLEEMTVATPFGPSWFHPPSSLEPSMREEYPQGCFNLGVAHGVPGVIGFLALALHVSAVRDRAGRLLESSVEWLLRQRLPSSAASCFPTCRGQGARNGSSRLAWCYGDLGIAMTLLLAGRNAREAGWEQEALAIARHAAVRPPGRCGVMDASLCHGAAGLAHMFNRLYQSTNDPQFAEAARMWLGHTLELRGAKGVAGFEYAAIENGQTVRVAEAGFLEGAAGVGLALLASVSYQEPLWDCVLLTGISSAPTAPSAPRSTPGGPSSAEGR